jgi:hypothetical protein
METRTMTRMVDPPPVAIPTTMASTIIPSTSSMTVAPDYLSSTRGTGSGLYPLSRERLCLRWYGPWPQQ